VRELVIKFLNNCAWKAAVPWVCQLMSMVGLSQISLAFISSVSVGTYENCCTRSTDVLEPEYGDGVPCFVLPSDMNEVQCRDELLCGALVSGLRPVQAICLYFAVSMEVVVGEVAELELLWNEEVVLSDNICKVGPLC